MDFMHGVIKMVFKSEQGGDGRNFVCTVPIIHISKKDTRRISLIISYIHPFLSTFNVSRLLQTFLLTSFITAICSSLGKGVYVL